MDPTERKINGFAVQGFCPFKTKRFQGVVFKIEKTLSQKL